MPVLLDTNLAVLLAVGLASPSHIETHRRTRQFNHADFKELQSIIARLDGLLLCPNVASETSNLARQCTDPLKTAVTLALKQIVMAAEETMVATKDAVERWEYHRLGVTDAVLLMLAATGAVLLTTDVPLYVAATNAGYQAINFIHLKELREDL